MQRFALAPMSALMWVLTAVCFALPVVFIILRTLWLVGAALLLLYLAVWLYWRPSHFEIGGRDLVIAWPLRRERIALSNIVRASVVSRHEFHRQYGRGVRVGVGGLFGQFGFSWTSRGLVRTYISTLGPFVLLELWFFHKADKRLRRGDGDGA